MRVSAWRRQLSDKIYVARSERWGEPRAKLLQGQDWHTNRVQVYRFVGHPLNAGGAVNALTRQLDTVYRQGEVDLHRLMHFLGIKEKELLTVSVVQHNLSSYEQLLRGKGGLQ